MGNDMGVLAKSCSFLPYCGTPAMNWLWTFVGMFFFFLDPVHEMSPGCENVNTIIQVSSGHT